MSLRVGTSGFSYKEWKGSFYPNDLPAKKMLQYYGEHFGAVEINYTFRSMPTESLLEGWASQVPADFQFVLKSPQLITHIRRLNNSAETVAKFFEVAATLKKRLGPSLFQLPPNFKKDAPRLDAFLGALPKASRAAFEFRHQSWFDDETFEVLRKHHAVLCIAEAEDELEIPFVSTADWGYVRLRSPEYNDKELKSWLKKIQGQKWRDSYVFFKHEDEARGPRMATRLLELAG